MSGLEINRFLQFQRLIFSIWRVLLCQKFSYFSGSEVRVQQFGTVFAVPTLTGTITLTIAAILATMMKIKQNLFCIVSTKS